MSLGHSCNHARGIAINFNWLILMDLTNAFQFNRNGQDSRYPKEHQTI